MQKLINATCAIAEKDAVLLALFGTLHLWFILIAACSYMLVGAVIPLISSKFVKEDGLVVSGVAKDVCYFDAGAFVPAERSGDLVTFPLGAMCFCAVGTGVSRMLHGSLVLQMTSSAGREHLPPAYVIFTLLI
ncbi:MAG: hypothetical protein IJU56_05780 [Clostridia bacterium]|nr:hypothetical protein [Clostridia bacterium]